MKTAREVIAQAVDATFMQRGFNADRHAEAVLTALSAAGWQVVPVTPTEEMLRAGQGWDGIDAAWRRMLAASPKD